LPIWAMFNGCVRSSGRGVGPTEPVGGIGDTFAVAGSTETCQRGTVSA